MEKVKNLKIGKTFDSLQLEVIEKGERKTFASRKTGDPFSVVACKGKDDTGEVNFSAWNEQIEMFEVGDTIEILGGLVNTFHDEPQATSGKFGTFRVLKDEEKSQEGQK